jgi:transcriptional antiterminator Rof (Rho-off)
VVYERRRSDNEFSRLWQLALCEGYDNLEMELLHRLRIGEVKPGAGARRAARSFDNGTAFRLLLAHRDSATRARATRENVSAAQVRAAIDRKVAEIRTRVLANKAAQQVPVAGQLTEGAIVEAPADAG